MPINGSTNIYDTGNLYIKGENFSFIALPFFLSNQHGISNKSNI